MKRIKIKLARSAWMRAMKRTDQAGADYRDVLVSDSSPETEELFRRRYNAAEDHEDFCRREALRQLTK